MRRLWNLPDDLAAEVLDRLGLTPPTTVADIEALVEAVGSRAPRGSTAKIRAIERGQRPAGDDPESIARAWLTDPHIAWTCWAVSTLTAALVHAGPLRADVLGVRRTDDRSPAVDIHSVVVISDGADRWVCDPHFGVGPLRATGGRFTRPGVEAELTSSHDGRFEWAVTVPSIPARLSYRSLTGPLDADDVAMFCDVSVAHSGMSARPSAMLLLHDGLGSLRADSWADPAELRSWRGSPAETDSFEVQYHRTWDAGMDALLLAAENPAAATGTRSGSNP